MPVAARRDPRLLRYVRAAQAAGVPFDQFERFSRAGIVLNAKQLLASAAARECDRPDGPELVAYGGARGGGKSFWAFAQLAVDDCQRRPELQCLILRKVGKANRENVEKLVRRLLRRIPHRYKAQGVVEFPNGSRIITGHFQNDRDIDAYLGLEYDVIVIEEVTTLTKGKIEDIETCCRTDKRDWRPRVYWTYNPGGVGHAYVKKRVYDPSVRGEERDTRFIKATVRDNPRVNKENRAKLERFTGWKRRAWLDGDHEIAVGQFFTAFRRETHVREGLTFQADWPLWLGFDYGYSHWTAVYLLTKSNDGVVYVLDEYGGRKTHVADNAAGIRAMLLRNKVLPEDLTTIQAGTDVFSRDRNGKSIADDYLEEGLRLERAQVDRLQGAAEIAHRLGDEETHRPPSLYIDAKCVRLIECLPDLQHDEHRSEDVKKVDCDENGDGGDDWYDALRYGVMWAARGPGVFLGRDPLD